jgi:hypothetical protein
VSPLLRRWAGRLVVLVLVWVGLCVGGYALEARPHPGAIGAVVAAVGAVLFLLLDVVGDQEPLRWPSAVSTPPRPAGEDLRTAQLTRVVSQHLDAHDPGETLHRQLTELTDRRLLAHHGVRRDADPEHAAALLGPELNALVGLTPTVQPTGRPAAQPSGRGAGRTSYPRLSLQQIERLVTRIEEI